MIVLELKLNYCSFDKFQEKLYSTTDLVENIQKIMKIRNDSSNDNIQSGNNLTRSESKSSYTEKNDEAVVDVLLVTQEKLNSNVRRRYETQVNSLFLLFLLLVSWLKQIRLGHNWMTCLKDCQGTQW